MYQDQNDLDDQNEYDVAPPKSPVVPILAVIAGVLAIAVGVVVVLFFMGAFSRQPAVVATAAPPPAQASAPAPAAVEPAADAQLAPSPATPQPVAETDVPKAAVSVAQPGQGEPPVRSTHGDWQVRCDTPPGAKNEQCVLMQFVTAEDRENVGLTVIVLKTADKKSRIMRVLAPLGVLLPSGLGLKIDNTDLGRAGFVRCLPNGCVAEVILEDKLLNQLETGKTATFIIFQTPEQGIGIPISLNGFGDGFKALP
jgi:invasion protein IalB